MSISNLNLQSPKNNQQPHCHPSALHPFILISSTDIPFSTPHNGSQSSRKPPTADYFSQSNLPTPFFLSSLSFLLSISSHLISSVPFSIFLTMIASLYSTPNTPTLFISFYPLQFHKAKSSLLLQAPSPSQPNPRNFSKPLENRGEGKTYPQTFRTPSFTTRRYTFWSADTRANLRPD